MNAVAARLLVHIVARSGAETDLDARVAREASRLRSEAGSGPVRVAELYRLGDDPLGPRTPYRATLELCAASRDDLVAAVSGLGPRIDDVAHADLCTALVGTDPLLDGATDTPVRYQYLMRRNSSFTHESYLERYLRIHSQFGLRTPGIRGYRQFHVDAEASRRAVASAALGVWGVDSVSELHLDSVEEFLEAVVKSSVGAEAMADEEVFVDRARSFDFCSRVS